MFYVIALGVNALVAITLAGLASVIAVALPVGSKRRWTRLIRGAATFAGVWLAIMIFGVIQMSLTRRADLGAARGALVVPGLVRSTEQVLLAEQISQGDTAQTYVLVTTSGEDVEAFAQASGMRAYAFDAHTAEARGWSTPDWWPKKPCPSGVTYNDEAFADPPRSLSYVINWCPSESRAYVQNFDY